MSEPRFKAGDLIAGTVGLERPDLVALVLSHCTGSLPNNVWSAVYKVLVDDKLMNLNSLYVDCYFEKLV